MQGNSNNKVALVSGSAKRIGKHIALYLANSGWKIALHYNNSEKEALKLKEYIDQISKSCLVKFDLNTQNNFITPFEKINSSLGKPRLLINNASIFERDDFMDLNEILFEKQMRVNCLSHLMLSKAFFQNNQNENLNIINMNDYASQTINSSFFSYCISKHAFLYASKVMAAKLAPKCRVNTISLGYVLKDEPRDEQAYQKLIANSPMKQQVKIQEICEAINFILKADSLTGSNIHIDGGMGIKSKVEL